MATNYLKVTFDISQESEKLNWVFLDADRQPMHKADGAETGLYVFEGGESLGLNVVANSYKEELLGVHIIDCHLIHRPILHAKSVHPDLAGEYPYPSPFFDPTAMVDGQGATSSFGHGVGQGSARQMTWNSPIELNYRNQGRWHTAFILTVAIQTRKGTSYRVFYFDPECQVGTGAVPQ